MNKITIKNVSTATVRLYDPETRFNRELAPGREIPISKDQYDNFLYDTGFMNILRGGFIKISGLKEDEVVEENLPESKGRDAIKEMLQDHNITAFAKFIPTASPADKESVIELARAMKITDSGITALIKKYCGIDIIQAINIDYQASEK